MSPIRLALRPLLAAALLPSLPAAAAPTAVNDRFTTPEDTPAGAAPLALLSASFDGGTSGIAFTLPNAWDFLDLKTSAAGGSNAFPIDALAESWKSPAFNPSTSTIPGWRSGTLPAQGGGISNANFSGLPNSLTGLVSGGPNAVNTYLARNRFTLTEAQAAHPAWNFTLLADDGCVIYLNGLEKARLNCPPGLNPDDLNGGNSGDELNYTTLAVDLSGALLAGTNVVAIELHQNSASSSDAGLDFALAPAPLAPTAGFTSLDDPFFATNNPSFSSQSHAPTSGFSSSGALRLQLGNVSFGASNQAVSGGWRKSFTLEKAATVSLTFRHRLISGQDYDGGEYQEALCDVDGTLYGSTTAPSTHPSVAFLVGNGNGGSPQDSGWQLSSFDIPLAAGEHTLTLGAYGSVGSAGLLGSAQESFEAFFDDVALTAPAALSLLANDSGATPLTAVKASDPAHGTVAVNADGTFRYSPAPHWFGEDSFTYRAIDPSGASEPATATIQVTPVNDLPIALGDGPYATVQDGILMIPAASGLLANDSDVDSPSLTAVLGTPSPDGLTQLQPDGSFTFTPRSGFSGATSFTYRASDGAAQSAPATVAILVDDQPAPPTANGDAYTAVQNTTLTVSATTPSSRTEELLPYKAPDWHYYDSLELASRNLGTTWRTDAYTESADWKVGPAELGYGDGDEATLIADNPDPAFASGASDKFATAYFRRAFEVADLYGISAVEVSVTYDDACAFYLNNAPGGRTSNLPDLAAQPELAWDYFPSTSISDNSTQTFALLPSLLQTGRNLVAAEVHQNAPTSSDLTFDLRLRVTRAIPASVLANDSDPDVGQTASLTAQLISPPAHGQLALSPNGTFTYTPDNNYTGPDAFSYRATDSTSLTSNVATVTLSVISGPNVPPAAQPDAFAATEDTLLSIAAANGLLANDRDAEGDPFTAALVSPPTHGSLQLQADGSFSYLPNSNFFGTDSFTYRSSDARPSPPATVTLTIAPVNDRPLAADDAYVGDPGSPLLISAAQGVLGNDSDVDPGTTLTAVLLTAPAAGSLDLQPDGSFTFTATAGGTYSFSYQAKDGLALSAPATVALALNAAPTTLSDSYSLSEDQALAATAALGVLANDADPEGQALTAALVTPPLHGSLALKPDGSFSYSPSLNFHGDDQFTYRANDGTRQSPPQTARLAIAPVNDAPVSLADIYGVRLNAPLVVSASNGLLRNDRDVDGESLTAIILTPPASGALALNPDGSFSFTPEPDFSGTASFTYRASDGAAQSAATTVTLNVTSDLNTVAISEIMYNPPGSEGSREEFIEIYNYGDTAVDLTGWRFTKGVEYLFPPGLLLPSKAYLAIPADRAAFGAKYPTSPNVTPTAWDVGGTLANGGESLRLQNPSGATVAEVAYADEGDWATRQVVPVWDSTNTPGATPPGLDTDPGLEWVSPADPNPELGVSGGASLQLRNLALSHQSGQNWAAATPTPGNPNAAVAQDNSPPLIAEVSHSPAVPNRTQQVFVTARLQDELPSGLTASLFYRTWSPSAPSPASAFIEVPLADNGLRRDGAPGDGLFGAVIPAQALDTVVEFYVRAADASAQTRTWPAPTLDLAGANPTQNANCLYQVNEEAWTDQRPLYQMIMTGADNASWNAGLANRTSNAAPNTTVIFRTGNQFDIRYQAAIRTRGNSSRGDTPLNLRLNIPKDHPWNRRSSFTLNYKYAYSQFLASRLFEAAGLPCEKANLVGGRINGVNRLLDQNGNRTFGYYCDLVPRGADTIKEWFPGNDSGNGYGKIRGSVRWGLSSLPTLNALGYAVGGYVNEGYNKQSNAAANDWSDLHAWLQSLNGGTIADFDATIANTVDIDQWCRFLALSTIVNHAETNVANGDDDDYSVYFGATDKLCRLIPHDFDTCFNLNALGLGDEIAPPTLTIYQATEPNYPTDNATLPQMDKFYRNPVLGRKFKAALRHYLDTLFAKAKFDATVDQLLDPQWMGNQFSPNGDAIRSHIKSFLDARRATIESFLPTAFTAASSLPLQNGLPRTTSPTDLGNLGGKIDPARTASVTVNGLPASTNPYGSTAAADNSWTASSALALQPGINNLLCEARDSSGEVIASQTLTLWYDAPAATRSGTLAASETWTARAGPYNISANLTVPSGVTLTIEPGTTVFLASGANLTVSAGGALLAPGTANAPINLLRSPAATGSWGGLNVNGGSATLSYLTFSNNGSTALHSTSGAVLALDHLSFRNPAVPFLSLDASSFVVSDCTFPSSTASFEPVHGSGGIAPGGQAIIRRCWFGKTLGYSDSIDFTGGNRPGPILQILNCVFTGSEDDILDLDSTDAWVEGNVFLHCHRNGASPDSSSAVSGGADNAAFSQVTVINNLFYDCDNAVTMKQGNSQPNGNSAVLLNNTIVRTTRVGGIDNGSGVVNFDDDNVSGEGKGMYLEGNIIWDAENLARNYNPALSQLTLRRNILPAAPPAGATASDNLIADPLLNLALIPSPAAATAAQVIAALQPQLGSPARAAGPLGRTLGADLARPGLTVASLPASTWPASFALDLGPGGSFTPTSQAPWTYGFTHYRYRLDGAPLSPEFPLGAPLALANLAPGPHILLVEGRNDAAAWQESPTAISFHVAPDAPSIALSEVLAASATSPDFLELHNWGTTDASIAGCRLSDDADLPGKYTFPSDAPPIPAGGYLALDAAQLGFSLDQGGETLRLSTPAGTTLDTLTFGPQIPDFSLARQGSAWHLSTPSRGSANPATAALPLGSSSGLRINEWLGSNRIVVTGDFVELYNPDPQPVDLAGFRLTQDRLNEPNQNQFPPHSFIAGSGFLELIADGNASAGADHLSFQVSRIRDSLTLIDPVGAVQDTALVLPGYPDISQGRIPDGAPTTGYLALPTPGFSNATDLAADSALMNGLRLTELMFAPPGLGAEFAEFKNIGAAPLALGGVTFASGLNFTFPAATLEPGAYLVLTGNLPRFQTQYPGVPALAWSSGRLDNSGESLRIETATHGLGILDFRYDGSWYPETRSGASLAIADPTAPRLTWSDPASWQPSLASPGGPSAFGVLAPPDASTAFPDPAILQALVSPGSFLEGSLALAWSKVSGPGTVTFTAPANKTTDAAFSLPGVYQLRLTATPADGFPPASDTVAITVREDFLTWSRRLLPSSGLPDQDPAADPDRDGLSNLLEYALGSSPSSPSAPPEVVLSSGRLALRYQVSRSADPALQIIPQISADLASWQEGSAYLNHTVTQQGDTSETHLAEALEPVGARTQYFLRLKVVAP